MKEKSINTIKWGIFSRLSDNEKILWLQLNWSPTAVSQLINMWQLWVSNMKVRSWSNMSRDEDRSSSRERWRAEQHAPTCLRSRDAFTVMSFINDTQKHRAHELVFGSVGLSRVTFHFEFNWIKKLKPLQCFCPDGSETSTEHRNSLNLRIHLMKHVCINVVSGVRISSELKESAEEQLLLHRPPCSVWRERRGLFSWLQTVTNRIIRGLLSKCILIQLLISCISSELYLNLFHGTSAGSAR